MVLFFTIIVLVILTLIKTPFYFLPEKNILYLITFYYFHISLLDELFWF